MNKRKEHVIQAAYRLFIDKGYTATSIQDILNESGISKGTFYNYFPSKAALFKAVFHNIRQKTETMRNELLVGNSPEDKEIFIKQIDVMLQAHKKTKLFRLIEQVFSSDDQDLKAFIQKFQIYQLLWMYQRLTDLFGKEKQPYLLDGSVLFLGMLHQMFHYTMRLSDDSFPSGTIIRYCLDSLSAIMDNVGQEKIRLLDPELIIDWEKKAAKSNDFFLDELLHLSAILKKALVKEVSHEPNRLKYSQMIEFIQEEIIDTHSPRYFLIESTLLLLDQDPEVQALGEFARFQSLLQQHMLDKQ